MEISSVNARMGRKGFALFLMVSTAFLFAVNFAFVHGSNAGVAGAIGAILLTVGRDRMHDLGFRARWAALPALALAFALNGVINGDPFSLITLASAAIGLPWLVFMLFVPGQPGGNRYGRGPVSSVLPESSQQPAAGPVASSSYRAP